MVERMSNKASQPDKMNRVNLASPVADLSMIEVVIP
jgi:hypothetical protein